MDPTIGIKMIGCRENNLKNIDVCIPYGKIVSFIGVSGSGKSTLVFDTLFAEGKRRYIESLGVNESFFISKQARPEADYFEGLPPAIALAQRHNANAGRSTAGTVSQAAYYIQVLFARCGNNTHSSTIPLTPSMFNLNSPSGVCPKCGGEGIIFDFDETLIWPNQDLSFSENGIKLGGATPGTTKYAFMVSFINQFGCDDRTPIRNYPNELKVALLYGQKKNKKFRIAYPGIITTYEQNYRKTKSLKTREEIERYMAKASCSCCGGCGYNPESLLITLGNLNIAEVMDLSIDDLSIFLTELNLSGTQKKIYDHIVPNLLRIIVGCQELGLGYLSLSRKTSSLSGGEFQRLHLVSQITSQISGVVYVLDEPSTGMHAIDIEKLIRSIRSLKETGNSNTVVMVEHTRALINASDYVFEMGPGAGVLGGQIIVQGKPTTLWDNCKSISGKYLSGKCTPGELNLSSTYKCDKLLRITGATSHNLKDITVELPLENLICVTGVSGSGKTSLVFQSFLESVKNKRNINVKRIEGMEQIRKVILCNQAPMGLSSRSCPMTYMDFYQNIREKFSELAESKKKKFTEKHFSFNVEIGRCPKCKGMGQIELDMAFLPSTTILCDECQGKRFKKSVLSIKYRGKNINDVLNMDAKEALIFFKDDDVIQRKLLALHNVGLEYIALGQSTSTLSGGEAQRLKLAYELSRPRHQHTLFVFDEPSKGLHFEDVKKLLKLFRNIVNDQNTVLLIEHNLDIISTADYLIDLGPSAGARGGEICGVGTPMQISKLNTPTGRALSEYYAQHKE